MTRHVLKHIDGRCGVERAKKRGGDSKRTHKKRPPGVVVAGIQKYNKRSIGGRTFKRQTIPSHSVIPSQRTLEDGVLFRVRVGFSFGMQPRFFRPNGMEANQQIGGNGRQIEPWSERSERGSMPSRTDERNESRVAGRSQTGQRNSECIGSWKPSSVSIWRANEGPPNFPGTAESS